MDCDYQYVKDNTLPGYSFPLHRLRRTCDPNRTPLLLVSCGSFSPITYAHLRMFPMAKDHAKSEDFEVIGSYLSPVSDSYVKKGLAPACQRIRMCELAAENCSKSLMVDTWEAESPTYIPTARVLDHFDYEVNEVLGGIECSDGTRKRARIVLLAGLDLIQTMSTPGVWDSNDLDHILGNYGVFAIERSGTKIDQTLANLKQWEQNIHIIRQTVTNDISSTKIRLLLRRGLSVKYLIPDDVISHIKGNHLYQDDADMYRYSKDKGTTDSGMTVAGPSNG
ncbi:hypothetical protein BGZ63DRAFT_35874 [Mariannaea sp. PMI_226]|nr:hypothetical protein BGZ63DRAFT_35874 [Mariannaea sp. PMI_226]